MGLKLVQGLKSKMADIYCIIPYFLTSQVVIRLESGLIRERNPNMKNAEPI